MKLFLVHCGYYDGNVCGGLFESHANLFVTGEDFENARTNAKQLGVFKEKRMHIDGLQEIQMVDGYQVELEPTASMHSETILVSHNFRELAPKPELRKGSQ